MLTLRKLCLCVAATVLLIGGSRAEAGVITLDLAPPTIVGSTASFDVLLTFDGNPDDLLIAVGLNPIHGSSPAIAEPSRWSFSLSSEPPLNSWFASDTIGLLGTEVLAPKNVFFGPFIKPGVTPLGTLSLDLSGLTPGSTVVASLNSSFTGGIGIIDGSLAISGLSRDLTVELGQPLGVSFEVPGGPVATVPEPSSLAVFGILSLGGTLYRRRSRRLGSCRREAE
ncbi:PEP-CTERM sorting domain-containing protein [Candidatus Laterigemmans baculatus]|uniref:PEP-CTERM sorting domain-containing protein n=1 Tax=Candidatus Laterigemmans baculatus TaxID=2770505 RepID=UPI0013DD556F|nr:PEP-CTERM sorting domain-containing protein [Candidatus Laterigemmans baculatus]